MPIILPAPTAPALRLMRRRATPLLALAAWLASGMALAASEAPQPALAAPAVAAMPASAQAPAPPAGDDAPPAHAAAPRGDDDDEKPRRWEGAIGLVANWGPEYAGAGRQAFKLVPAGFVRYGRVSISAAGGFGSARRSDDVDRGVAAALMDRETLRVSLGLRADSGRRESSSDRLAGMGDIDPTLRAQLTVNWRPERHWSLTTGISVDALSQGNGWWLQLGASRNFPLTRDTALAAGASVRWVGQTYAQRWYGVTPAQSQASGYPAYAPGDGLADLTLGLRLRTDFGPRWSGFLAASASRLLGPAARGPLAERESNWGLGSGLVWRF
ncbi:MAG: MipA/OmpV family protein [Burkholderiales bacterium]|nr:MipA/OmpV family protein [Burkholderiales bacterium]